MFTTPQYDQENSIPFKETLPPEYMVIIDKAEQIQGFPEVTTALKFLNQSNSRLSEPERNLCLLILEQMVAKIDHGHSIPQTHLDALNFSTADDRSRAQRFLTSRTDFNMPTIESIQNRPMAGS